MDAHGRRERPVEFSEPILPEPLHFHECRGRISNQGCDVDALAPRRERRQVARAARQHVDRAVVIQPPQMMERDADLQDALIETAHLTSFSQPQPFECLVLLEVLAAIELGNPLQQQNWWSFVTGRHRLTRLPPAERTRAEEDQNDHQKNDQLRQSKSSETAG